MIQYRKLTLEELETLEKEFIDFLVVNGITADEWQQLKEEKRDKAESIIEAFSNVVFESLLRKAMYLDYVGEKMITCFQALKRKMVLVVFELPRDTTINLTEHRLDQIDQDIYSQASVYTTDKSYQGKREEELFELLKKGASLSDGSLFKKLCLLL